ncbi:MAG: 4Fe-4S binding protein [Methanosarcinaceae archaeon]|nr:4Fe-4S binding protein [Methanosarcinaceae archaeon]
MLKITPYIWLIVFIVSIGGLWFPILGYVMAVVMLTLMTTAVFRGRWFCGNLCPRGSLYDFTVSKMSQNRNVPSILSSYRVRIPVFVVTMGFMIYRLTTALGTQNTFDNIGTVLASMCVTMTIISVSMGTYLKPRAWCAICPMGTLQRVLGGSKYQLKMAHDKCIDCKICEKKCPMDLEVRDIGNNPDCIKCGRCVVACPKDALEF